MLRRSGQGQGQGGDGELWCASGVDSGGGCGPSQTCIRGAAARELSVLRLILMSEGAGGRSRYEELENWYDTIADAIGDG